MAAAAARGVLQAVFPGGRPEEVATPMKVEGAVPKGYKAPNMAIDGILFRKTSFNSWVERYFRVTRNELGYWSHYVGEIKASKAVGRTRGPYKYSPVGKASQTYDLRRPGMRVMEPGLDPKIIELRYASGEVVEMKAESEKVAEAWRLVLCNVAAYEAALADRVIGSLEMDVDGVYVVGEQRSHAPADLACVGVEVRFDGGAWSSPEGMAPSVARDKVLYENLDEVDDVVSFARVKLSVDSLDVHRANASFVVSVYKEPVAAHAQRSSFSLKASSDKKFVLGQRRISLFEQRFIESAETEGNRALGGLRMPHGVRVDQHLSALDGDASCQWPGTAPDGHKPKGGGGWGFLPVFDENDDDDDDSKWVGGDGGVRHRRIVALVHARIKLRENLINVVDIDGRERFEYDYLEDEAIDADASSARNRRRKQYKTRDVSSEALMSVVARLGTVVEQLADLKPDVFTWRDPPVSAATWFAMLVVAFSIPSSASLCLFLCVALGWLAFSLADAAHQRVAAFTDAERVKHLVENAPRQVATLRVAALRAESLAAADYDILAGEARDSDAYVAVLNSPGDPTARDIEKIAPTLVGITEVRPNTLDPVWCDLPTLGQSAEIPSISVENNNNNTKKKRQRRMPSIPRRSGTGVDATKLPAKQRQTLFHNPESEVARAPADFRAPWLCAGTMLRGNCWAVPILQEAVNVMQHAPPRIVPWAETKGRVVFRVYDANILQTETFLGQCELPVSHLVKHIGEPRVYVMALQPSRIPSLDKQVVEKELNANRDLGTLRVVASLDRGVDDSDSRVGVFKKALAVDAFERKAFMRGKRGKKARVSTYEQLKDIRRSFASALDMLETGTSMLERLYALLTWEHPAKTALVVLGLVSGVVACCLIPNNFLCAALMSKFFLQGLVERARGEDFTRIRKVDPTEIQLKNLLNALPNAPQRDRAIVRRRAVFKAQTSRNEMRARISLNFGLRVRLQAYVYVYKPTHLAASWEREYVIVVDGALLCYASIEDALKAPTKGLKRKQLLVPPPLGGAWLDDAREHADDSDLPARDMPVFFVAVYVHEAGPTVRHIARAGMVPAKETFAVKTREAYENFKHAVEAESASAKDHNAFFAGHEQIEDVAAELEWRNVHSIWLDQPVSSGCLEPGPFTGILSCFNAYLGKDNPSPLPPFADANKDEARIEPATTDVPPVTEQVDPRDNPASPAVASGESPQVFSAPETEDAPASHEAATEEPMIPTGGQHKGSSPAEEDEGKSAASGGGGGGAQKTVPKKKVSFADNNTNLATFGMDRTPAVADSKGESSSQAPEIAGTEAPEIRRSKEPDASAGATRSADEFPEALPSAP
ncbi:hypothetical protein CTAYLR_007578 [Chrysophaeum taylorii]|uniref:PH domain-containing protein n=1 Tax=Chrysophaeum taylorii TaxID=2483200 RepID=A0AAD7UE76_9STRA|nr:hypothetical protein CTAYLR_007578 [Chrysophaeum taylorii]